MKILVRCPICGEDIKKANILYNRLVDKILKCKKCKSLFSNPQYEYNDLEKLYEDNFYNPENNEEENYRKEEHERNKESYILTIDQIKNHLKSKNKMQNPQHCKILDFGSGPGAFLFDCKNSGFDTVGVEFSKVACQFAREYYGLKIIEGTEKTLSEFPSNYFDVVTCWNVIEHLTDPRPILNEFYRILKDGGLLCISTPNVNSYGHLINKEKWSAVIQPSHMIFFTNASLKKLLFSTGFRRVKRVFFWGGETNVNNLNKIIQYLFRVLGINSSLRIYSEK